MKISHKILYFLVALLMYFETSGQNSKKKVIACKSSEIIKIDGQLNESTWMLAQAAGDFVMFEPYNGRKASHETYFKVLFDNNAVYFGIAMSDSSPDSIFKDYGKRDDFNTLNADIVTIDISPFNDGLYAFSFKVSASGIQADEKYAPNSVDQSWNEVWDSEVCITDFGWTAEVKIPFSALRFPDQINQIWGLNIWRQVRRTREWMTWSYVDKNNNNYLSQAGEIHGIQNLDPGLRLSLSPYLSTMIQHQSSSNALNYHLNGGMDLKLGLDESFTLDMSLIPDFGYVQADDMVLNLSPFEIKYDEKRQFFTEGTELFTKGKVFYSRRIGKIPVNYNRVKLNLKPGETIKENPMETRLINASKISGRTKNGFGLGVFNAMTANTFATILDSLQNERKELSQAFTNYNMIVLDQSLKNNSYLSFINTNVSRKSDKYSANVTGTEFLFSNRKNSLSLKTRALISQKYDSKQNPIFGHTFNTEIGKMSGKFQYVFTHLTESNTYDPNDLGFLQNNNKFTNSISFKHNIYQPFYRFLHFSQNITFFQTYLYLPRKFTSFTINYNANTKSRNHFSTGINFSGNPVETHDYYEARAFPKLFIKPPSYYLHWWCSSDYRKRLALDVRAVFAETKSWNHNYYSLVIAPRMRLTGKWVMVYQLSGELEKNKIGYVSSAYNDSIGLQVFFGNRRQNIITNTISNTYVFSKSSHLTFRLRHYFTTVEYNKFFKLNNEILETVSIQNNYNLNFNIFNIDGVYTWYFQPGSEISIVWKNYIQTYSPNLEKNYLTNIINILNDPQINSISIRLLYYIDYQKAKKLI